MRLDGISKACLHGTVVGCGDPGKAGVKDHTVVWGTPHLDGSRQEALAFCLHAILSCHCCNEKFQKPQPLQCWPDRIPAREQIACMRVGRTMSLHHKYYAPHFLWLPERYHAQVLSWLWPSTLHAMVGIYITVNKKPYSHLSNAVTMAHGTFALERACSHSLIPG